jgi:hypothetical protein
MAQQKSDSRIVPEGLRKLAPSHGVGPSGGGKAAAVTGDDRQLVMSFATAENPRTRRGAESVSKPSLLGAPSHKVPKANANPSQNDHARIERSPLSRNSCCCLGIPERS